MPDVNFYEQINNQIGFDVYAQQILGTGFSNVKLIGVMDADTARVATGIDPAAMHSAIFPFLPPGSVPNDYRKYNYVVIQFLNGQRTALGVPWIVQSSVTVINTRSYSIVITDVSPADAEEPAKILAARGFNVVSTTPIEA